MRKSSTYGTCEVDRHRPNGSQTWVAQKDCCNRIVERTTADDGIVRTTGLAVEIPWQTFQRSTELANCLNIPTLELGIRISETTRIDHHLKHTTLAWLSSTHHRTKPNAPELTRSQEVNPNARRTFGASGVGDRTQADHVRPFFCTLPSSVGLLRNSWLLSGLLSPWPECSSTTGAKYNQFRTRTCPSATGEYPLVPHWFCRTRSSFLLLFKLGFTQAVAMRTAAARTLKFCNHVFKNSSPYLPLRQDTW